ncbi:unnamed protein product [Acanthoscelides obtectus]|uniref:Uncharacterized protein n=1 Tax=Acanthoscelides obtectus TaxID=200917 RepID=A0A9P0PZZ8_ACAOB|nr:unnamed protein product [Acanthoscelides obtectus]CAK1637692.1 hypothetical protein AOBTE_LOCUS10133 [Acanthoscelides obtectus]
MMRLAGLLLAFFATVQSKAADISSQGFRVGHEGLPQPNPQNLHQFNSFTNQDKLEQICQIIMAQGELINFFGRKLDAFDMKLNVFESSVLKQLNMMHEQLVGQKNIPNVEALERNLAAKYQHSLDKIQGTTDTIQKHLEKLEQQMEKRDSNLEAELSYAVGSLEMVKAKQKILETKIGNNTSSLNAGLNMTKHIQKLVSHYHTDEKKHMNRLHDNIINSLVYLDNKTTEHFLISDANNQVLSQLKKELKEDFNSYANKVADMTTDQGTSSKNLQVSLNNIKSQISTLQTGYRGVVRKNGTDGPSDSIVYVDGDIKRALATGFEKVLANQQEFIKGCYKVQMQEPQIESEISDMLERMLDMLEKRFAVNDRDANTFKHFLKNNHEQAQRNMLQLNDNIASVYKQSSAHFREIEGMIAHAQERMKALYAYVKNALPEKGKRDIVGEVQESLNALQAYLKRVLPEDEREKFKDILDKLQKIEEYMTNLKGCPNNIKPELENIQNSLSHLTRAVKPIACAKNHDVDTKNAVQNVFGKSPSSANSGSTDSTDLGWDPALINIRGDLGKNRNLLANNETETVTESTSSSLPTYDELKTTVLEIASQSESTIQRNDELVTITTESSSRFSTTNESGPIVGDLKSPPKAGSNDESPPSVGGDVSSPKNESNDETRTTVSDVISSPKVETNNEPAVTESSQTDQVEDGQVTTVSGVLTSIKVEAHDEPVSTVGDDVTSRKVESTDEPGTTVSAAISKVEEDDKKSNDEPETTVSEAIVSPKLELNDEPKTTISEASPNVESNNDPETTMSDFGSSVKVEAHDEPESTVSDVTSSPKVADGTPPKLESTDEPEISDNVSSKEVDAANDEPGRTINDNVTSQKVDEANDEPGTTVGYVVSSPKIQSNDELETTLSDNVTSRKMDKANDAPGTTISDTVTISSQNDQVEYEPITTVSDVLSSKKVESHDKLMIKQKMCQ